MHMKVFNEVSYTLPIFDFYRNCGSGMGSSPEPNSVEVNEEGLAIGVCNKLKGSITQRADTGEDGRAGEGKVDAFSAAIVSRKGGVLQEPLLPWVA